ncbi:MAG: hypothetical protein HDQ88_08510, partial [Clostridia bacterium]|nr:hypothetical protein [Clostridia bacterium]
VVHELDNFPSGKMCSPAASIGNKALFGAGAYANSTYYSNVDVIDDSLTLSKATDTTAVDWGAGCSSDNCASFSGGWLKGSNAAYNMYECYTETLSRYTAYMKVGRAYHRMAAGKQYQVAVGGLNLRGSSPTSITEAADGISGTVKQYSSVVGRMHPFVGSSGLYIIIAGGSTTGSSTNEYTSSAEYIEAETGVHGTLVDIEHPVWCGTAVSINGYVLLAGGQLSSGKYNDEYGVRTINVYDPELTKRDSLQLSMGTYAMAGATTSEYAMIGGSYDHRYVEVFGFKE